MWPKNISLRASQALAAVAAVDSAPGREICEELIAGTEDCRRGRGAVDGHGGRGRFPWEKLGNMWENVGKGGKMMVEDESFKR